MSAENRPEGRFFVRAEVNSGISYETVLRRQAVRRRVRRRIRPATSIFPLTKRLVRTHCRDRAVRPETPDALRRLRRLHPETRGFRLFRQRLPRWYCPETPDALRRLRRFHPETRGFRLFRQRLPYRRHVFCEIRL